MALSYALTLPEILSGTSAPAIEITGLASLPVAAATGVGVWGYNRYNKNMERLNERAHYSDRNADRLIRNIGRPSRRGSVVIPEGYLGSQSNPVQLGNIIVTPEQNAVKTRSFANQAVPTDSTGVAPAPPAPAPTDSTSASRPQPASSSTGSGTASPAPANPNDNGKKGFKDRQKQVLNRLKQGYGNALIGLEYGVGFGLPVAGLGYAAYRWMQPGKTSADSILDSQLYQVGELNKAIQINENQKKIDAILQQIQGGSPKTQSSDSGYFAPQQTVAPTDTLDF